MPWAYPAERVAKVTAQRRAEQQAMRDYASTPGCRMVFLRTLLDDPDAGPCGRCDRCRGEPLDGDVPTRLVGEATAFLRSSALVVDPRKQWIRGTGRPKVPLDEQASSGRALGILGDGGWGTLVRRARSLGEPFGDELLDATVRVVQGWLPVPAPEWLTVVPSATDGGRLEDFARRLAVALGLPFVEALARRAPAPPQAEMANSVQQLRNVEDAFAVDGEVPAGAVLLVDDVVQSGWTMTVCAARLRRAGAKAVHPIALAKGGGG
jgi:ATP-dependent DNA helicase RecQ